eukprot:m.335295 g.335295  ORF g.335295 m.335295 type:complete len:193 (+) comp55677_c0_seq6:1738-2316(+)
MNNRADNLQQLLERAPALTIANLICKGLTQAVFEEQVAPALARCATLTYLNLSGNGLTCLKHLRDAIQESGCRLTFLNISANKLGASAFEELLEILELLPSLKALEIQGNHIPLSTKTRFAQAVHAHPSLKEVMWYKETCGEYLDMCEELRLMGQPLKVTSAGSISTGSDFALASYSPLSSPTTPCSGVMIP